MITPRTLKGFRDYLPEAMIPRERLMETAREVYRSFGFAPIDTPALEYLEVLNGKGGEESDRQLYQFEDHGGRKVGMRFDLTVPLARFVAQYANELGAPFKRYHLGTVWRGESPQRGRYREFMQCDFDTIGVLSEVADIETAVVIHTLLRRLGFERFQIRVNHRQLLNGLLDSLGLASHSQHVLRAIDKLPKVGEDAVIAEMVENTGASPDQARDVLQLTALEGAPDDVLRQAETALAGHEAGRDAVMRLRALLDGFAHATQGSEALRLDLSIARGLDYYTGVVFETFLDDLPGMGSVCSGGRYDDLASTFTKQQLPGIGASLGLDRLLAAMEELQLLSKASTPAPILLPYFDADRLPDYLRIASQLREAGFGVELFPEPKKLKQQLKYADRRGFRIALIIGGDEFEQGVCQIKDLRDGESVAASLADGLEDLKTRLAALLSR